MNYHQTLQFPSALRNTAAPNLNVLIPLPTASPTAASCYCNEKSCDKATAVDGDQNGAKKRVNILQVDTNTTTNESCVCWMFKKATVQPVKTPHQNHKIPT